MNYSELIEKMKKECNSTDTNYYTDVLRAELNAMEKRHEGTKIMYELADAKAPQVSLHQAFLWEQDEIFQINRMLKTYHKHKLENCVNVIRNDLTTKEAISSLDYLVSSNQHF